jgi:heat-inducible transcriptional repressor
MDILNDREKMVLEFIMERYINSAEPIGSGTLAKAIRDRLSPATIRNVMADLEEQGFLYKPHVVAGRVPTYKAYRYYVNRLSGLKSPGKKELLALETMMKPHYSYVEEIMEDASKVLAAISKYTSIVVEPKVDMMLFKEVEFVKLSSRTILAVFVTSSGMVHTRMVNTDEEFGLTMLNSMKSYMNDKFGGVPFYALKQGILEDIRKDRENYSRLLSKIKQTLETIIDEEDTREIYMEGTSKIIGVPEFTDMDRLKGLFQAFEKKEKLLKLIDECLQKEGIHVIIGSESDIKEMRDMSIITSTYKVGEKSFGVLGVIGPIRMNYSKMIPLVTHAAKTVTNILTMV